MPEQTFAVNGFCNEFFAGPVTLDNTAVSFRATHLDGVQALPRLRPMSSSPFGNRVPR